MSNSRVVWSGVWQGLIARLFISLVSSQQKKTVNNITPHDKGYKLELNESNCWVDLYDCIDGVLKSFGA